MVYNALQLTTHHKASRELRTRPDATPLVMCRLGLGLEAPALAWLWAAQASQNNRPGLGSWPWLGPAWLWPEPRLLVG